MPHKVLVVGEGPARQWFETRLPDAVFTGFQGGVDLARAVASMDVFFNPSITETFGNVTLEAMACRLPVVAADATGSESLVLDGTTGRLIRPGAVHAFAEALRAYIEQPAPAQRPRRGGRAAQHRIQLGPDQPGGRRHLCPADPPARRPPAPDPRHLAQRALARLDLGKAQQETQLDKHRWQADCSSDRPSS